jgi:predicted RNA binding protein YcfA (HicA-like mRNA interferase family)
MPKTVSGEQAMKILVKQFGFVFVSQKGSHAKLKKILVGGNLVTIVPLHRELARGTLGGILELAKVEFKDFEKFI